MKCYIILTAILVAGLISPVTAQDTKLIENHGHPLSGDIVPASSEIKPLIERYSVDERSLNRYYTFPFSSTRRSRFKAFNQEWLDILTGTDFKRLSKDGQVDYTLFKNHLKRSLYRLKQEELADKATAPLLPFASTIIKLNEDLKKMEWIDSAKAAEVLNEIKVQIETKREALETQLAVKKGSKGKDAAIDIKRITAKRAVSMIDLLRNGLKEWFDFYNGYNPLFTWWAAKPFKTTDQALQSYVEFLEEKLVIARPGEQKFIFRDPVGRQALVDEMVFEMIPYTPEEILALGFQELAWCEKERLAATQELGYGDDWQKAIEHVKKRSVKPGEQPELIRFMAFEAIDFLEKYNSLTIPPMVKELIRMEMMSPERQRFTPFFTGGELISVAYPTNTMPYEQIIATMRGNNPHFSRAVVHHELVPGHNLQMFMAARHKSYRSLFRTRFFIEGWPLYWEMRLWDMEFQKSSEDRIGMLFWRMHRCARIIFSLSFHLKKMTGEECIDFLVNRIGHERDNATVEVTRDLGALSNPLNQISYLVGGLQIRALSRNLVDSGKMTPKAFHDAMLLEGSIPVELVRAKLIERELHPDFTSKWKFYTFNIRK